MSHIRVRPERLRELSARLQQTAGAMREQDSHLQQAIAGLDWEANSRDDIEAEVRLARGQVSQLAESADLWGRWLAQKAEEFEQADQDAARAFQGVTSGSNFHPRNPGFGPRFPGRPELTPLTDPVYSIPPGKGVPATDHRQWLPVDAAVISTPAERAELGADAARNRYDQVLDQFNVAENPRYRPGKNTYCNIFVTDATRAMGAEIPHWVNREDGSPVAPGTAGADELDANETARWLDKHGSQYGWREVPPELAQEMANDGRPAVVVRENPGSIGHVAMVRPGEYSPEQGCAIANVGASNKAHSTTRGSFLTTDVKYWVHS